ncbi:MAG: hypothetical protein U1E50_17840 [Caulobacteraceae bacterium]
MVDDGIIGPYHLQAIDSRDSAMVVWREQFSEVSEGKISPAVFKVGADRRFLVAARHPLDADLRVDTARTEYFYITLNQGDVWAYPRDEEIHGPFDAAGFAREKARLGLPEFDQNLEE